MCACIGLDWPHAGHWTRPCAVTIHVCCCLETPSERQGIDCCQVLQPAPLLASSGNPNEKDYQSVLWESAGFMQVKVGA